MALSWVPGSTIRLSGVSSGSAAIQSAEPGTGVLSTPSVSGTITITSATNRIAASSPSSTRRITRPTPGFFFSLAMGNLLLVFLMPPLLYKSGGEKSINGKPAPVGAGLDV